MKGKGGQGASPGPQSNWPIYLYVPNLIGYARILANVIAFSLAFTNKNMFVALYFISFICDELDGRFARMLNQTSTLGAVLDMVTDRVSTAGLLVLLTHMYKSWFGLFLGLLALDISSHWVQMYSTFLASKTSHKEMGDSKSTLLRLYYHHRFFMGYCAIGAEIVSCMVHFVGQVMYLFLYILASDGQNESPLEVVMQTPYYVVVLLAALPGCAIKQLVNLVQIKNCSRCVHFLRRPTAKRQEPIDS